MYFNHLNVLTLQAEGSCPNLTDIFQDPRKVMNQISMRLLANGLLLSIEVPNVLIPFQPSRGAEGPSGLAVAVVQVAVVRGKAPCHKIANSIISYGSIQYTRFTAKAQLRDRIPTENLTNELCGESYVSHTIL